MTLLEFMSDSPFLTAFIVYCVCAVFYKVVVLFGSKGE